MKDEKQRPKNDENRANGEMDTDNRYHCTIENFIMDEYSICREERQYAVFLYNILRKYRKKQSREKLTGEEKTHILEIFEACGIEADMDIEHVFYEATFMRDFFERERRYSAITEYHDNPARVLLQKKYANEKEIKTDFNRRLIKYVFGPTTLNPLNRNTENNEHQCDDAAYLRYNLGRSFPEFPKDCKDKEKIEPLRKKTQAMMNAKPDIAVIYKKNDQRYLLFIECKFESYETTSKANETEILRQCSIQYDIARFLCNHCLNEKLSKSDQNAIHVSPIMKSDGKPDEKSEKKSKIVKFMRSNKADPSNGEIRIKMLIDYNNKIFEDNN